MTAVRAIAIRVDVWHRALLLGNKKHPQTISVCERWITLARRCEAARLFVRVGSELSIERLASSGQWLLDRAKPKVMARTSAPAGAAAHAPELWESTGDGCV
jgi:hypothetical protein